MLIDFTKPFIYIYKRMSVHFATAHQLIEFHSNINAEAQKN